MKRSSTELIVGGVIFLSLFILIAGVLWLKEVRLSSTMVRYTVLFPNIGTLQQGDPVTVNGVKKGIVADITLHKTQVAVVLKMDRNVRFTDSSTVTVQNIGLMGERMVGILLSDKGTVYAPDTKNHVTYIPGYFDSGIAEAMGMLGSVLSNVMGLIDTVQVLVRKTVGDTNFISFFNTLVVRLDTISYLVERLLKENRNDLTASIDNIHMLTRDLKQLLTQNRGNVDEIMANGTQLTSDALKIAGRIDSLAVTLNTLASRIERGEGSVGMLINDEKTVMELRKSIADLDSLVNDVTDHGLRLRLKLFGNKKYFKEDTIKKEP